MARQRARYRCGLRRVAALEALTHRAMPARLPATADAIVEDFGIERMSECVAACERTVRPGFEPGVNDEWATGGERLASGVDLEFIDIERSAERCPIELDADGHWLLLARVARRRTKHKDAAQ